MNVVINCIHLYGSLHAVIGPHQGGGLMHKRYARLLC